MKTVLLGLLCVLGLCACGGGTTQFGSDASDGTMEGGTCASNADCNDGNACTTDLCLVGGVCSHTAVAGCATDGGSMTCTSTAQCDDHIACTTDACLVSGTCSHTPSNAMCPSGQMCVVGTGCTATCTTNADCVPAFACLNGTCLASGMCSFTAVNSRCAAGMQCNPTMGCVAATACETAADCGSTYCMPQMCNAELGCMAMTPPNCDDMNACTTDACDNTIMMCTHTMNPACVPGEPGTYNLATPFSYMCGDPGLGSSNASCTALVVADTASGLSVNCIPVSGMSPPPTLSGAAPSASGMFTVMGSRLSGGEGCDEYYALTGTFTSPTMVTGTFTIMYVDVTGLGACTDLVEFPCADQSFMVSGTLM